MNHDPLRSYPAFLKQSPEDFKYWLEDQMDYRLSGWADCYVAYDRKTNEVLGFQLTSNGQHYINPELLKDLQHAEHKGRGLRSARQRAIVSRPEVELADDNQRGEALSRGVAGVHPELPEAGGGSALA